MIKLVYFDKETLKSFSRVGTNQKGNKQYYLSQNQHLVLLMLDKHLELSQIQDRCCFVHIGWVIGKHRRYLHRNHRDKSHTMITVQSITNETPHADFSEIVRQAPTR